MNMTELFLVVVSTTIAVGAVRVVLPGYFHHLMSAYRRNRKLYTYKIEIGGNLFYRDGGRARLKVWEDTPGAVVTVLHEKN